MTVSLVKATDRECPPDWACVDCLMLLANGELDPNMTDQERADFLARYERGTDGYQVTLGMFAKYHDDTCPNVTNGQWTGNAECFCEERTFSWSPCGVCGSNLGGSRHAVTFWLPKSA